jgi:lipoprotein-anchoring transpeptidase ErfK/SrfK
VKVFDRGGKSLGLDIVPFADRDRGGVDVSVGNIDGGAESEIVTSIYRFGRSLVKTYKADTRRTIIGSFEGWPETVQSGYQVTTGDLDRDDKDEILVAVAAGSAPHVRAFEANGRTLPQNFFPFEKDFRGGVYLAVGDIDGDQRMEIVAISGGNTAQGRKYYQKYIEVSLSEQRLYAYESGSVKKTFLVSTGIKKYPTPTGTFAVRSKTPNKDYEWSYGPNHPDNYDLKNVKNNLNFSGNYFLHEAYWHHNFGHVMSHGCVNINAANSKWLYDWAEVGTPVIVKQ